MKAWRLHKIGDFRLDEVERPIPKGEEILLKVEACGICGSDLPRVYQLGTKRYPLTTGHEFAGEVVAVGENADSDLIGKKAAVYPLIPCGKCQSCRIGNYAQCSDYGYLGSRNDGGFAEYCLVPNAWHLVISDHDDFDCEALCMAEPASVALHAVRKGNVSGAKTVVIFGAGPIGIMVARWCKIFGANVVLVDIDDEKVAFGKARGFQVINSVSQDCIEAVRQFTDGRMADVVIEGTGTAPALNHAVNCLKPHGTIVMLGNPNKDVTLKMENHSQILRKELSIIGVWNHVYNDLPLNEWRYTVKMMDEGILTVTDLITHRAGIDDLGKLFDQIHGREIKICKAIYSSKEMN